MSFFVKRLSRRALPAALALAGALNIGSGCTDVLTPSQADIPMAAALTPAGTPGLLGAYPFNEGSGSVALDASGNGAHGTVVGATWSTDGALGGVGNYSLSFGNYPHYSSPSVAWVEIPEAALAPSTSGLTVAAWVKGGWGMAVVFGKQLYGSYRDSFALFRGGNGAWIFSVDGDVGGNQGLQHFSPDPVEWTHVAATYNGSTVALYLDGALAASAPVTTVIKYDGSPVTIGADYDIFGAAGSPGAVPDAGWPGLIDDAEIHSKALSAAEIAQLAAEPPPPPPPGDDPTTKDDCKNGGWLQFGFKNQGQCVRFLETGKDSR